MNSFTEGESRALPADRFGEIVQAPTSAVRDLSTEVADAAQLNDAKRGQEARERSSIESRTDLRLAATNEAMRADPQRTENTLNVTQGVARQWVNLDVVDFSRIRSSDRREQSLDAIASHASVSPEYKQELKERSLALSQATDNILAARAQVEQQLSVAQGQINREAAIDSANEKRGAELDAASLANVAFVRSMESARVAKALTDPLLADIPAAAVLDAIKQPEPSRNPVSAPPAAVQPAIKRPIDDAELSAALRDRFIVSHEKRGLWDKGTTEFTFRKGEQQGRVAFVDTGKSLSTTSEDKETIKAMLDVVQAKNWKTVTLSGSEDFKRSAWLEASLSGLEVRGYEPREADKILLRELRDNDRPRNAIVSADRDRSAPSNTPVQRASARQVDGDTLSPGAQTVVDNSRAFLMSKNVGEAFADATLRDLVSKFRTYEGEIIDHGQAPYKFDADNEPSYFVALKTPAGEQVVWGKGLADVMQDRRSGEQVALQNIGRKQVTVTERLRDASGVVVSTRPKESALNQWKVEVTGRVNSALKASQVPDGRMPTFKVFDPKAARKKQPELTALQQQGRGEAVIKSPARER